MPAYVLDDPDVYARRVNEATAAEVRAAMGRRRVNQTQLAKALGMSAPALSRRLNGEVPFDVVELAQIADLLESEIRELVRSRCFYAIPGDGPEPGQMTLPYDRPVLASV